MLKMLSSIPFVSRLDRLSRKSDRLLDMSITERAIAARRPRFEPSKPDYIVRTQGPNNDRNWLTLGAAAAALLSLFAG